MSPSDSLTATAWGLALAAVALAWPVPWALSRASWPARSPATAMALWQAIALSGGLSMIGAFVCWGLAPEGRPLGPALVRVLSVFMGMSPAASITGWHVVALVLAALLLVHLLATLIMCAFRNLARRRTHRDMLNLLAEPSDDTPRTLVLDSDSPLAYCVPGQAAVRVLSTGMLGTLTPGELNAVLAHEQAHLSQRHDILLLAFQAWHDALPWLPTTRWARTAVAELVEMLADNQALVHHRREDLVAALAVASQSQADPAGPGRQTQLRTPERSPSSATGQTPPASTPTASFAVSPSPRIVRLLAPPPTLRAGVRVGVGTSAVALALVPALWLAINAFTLLP